MSKKIVVPRFTDDSDIRLGFEVECYVRGHKWAEFERIIRAMGVQIGDDGSIEPPYCDGWVTYDYEPYNTAELRTRPLPPRSAMSLLKEVLHSLHGRGGTNDSCGLHVNISSTNKTKMRRFRIKRFVSSRLWQQMLRRFKREDNDYCMPLFDGDRPPTKRELQNGDDYVLDQAIAKVHDKYACVNTCHFGNGESRESRIEIRAMGNLRYHCRYRLIAYFVGEIIKQFEWACRANPKPKVKKIESIDLNKTEIWVGKPTVVLA